MLKEKKIIFLVLFSVFSFLLAKIYTVRCLGRTCLRIYLCSEMNYCREYLCTAELEVFKN